MTCKCVHDRRLTRKKAAQYIGYKPETLDRWASKKINLKYYTIGGRAYYDVADLDQFLKGKQAF